MNYWDQQDNEPFRDGQEDEQLLPGDFAYAAPARPAPQPRKQAPVPVTAEEYVHEDEDLDGEVSEDEDDFTDVLSDARLRLEQGRLYELLMNHNLFEGVQADARAIKNVQREIRQYARERMEIMLGMRQSAPAQASQGAGFSDMETSVLKMLASAASKGKTQAPPPPVREGLAPMAPKQAPPQATIKSVAQVPQKSFQPKTNPALENAKPPAKPAALPKKAVKPLERKANPQMERILAEEGVPRELLEEDYKPLQKDPSLMTEEERIKRNNEISKRLRKQATNSAAKPMPSYDQQAAMYAAQASEVASTGPMSILLAAVSRKR